MKTETVPEGAAPLVPTDRRRRLPRLQELGLVLVILIMGTVLSIFGYIDTKPGQRNLFLNSDNLIGQVATSMSYYAIMAVGMTLVIVSGGIDISVGSTMALAGLGAAGVLQRMQLNAPPWQVLPVALAVPMGIGLLCGLANGLLIVGLDVHPFIVTLGTLSIFRCIAVVTPSVATLPSAGNYLPVAFADHFMRLEIWGVRPMPMVIMLVVVAIGWFYLSQTVGGREIYAVGGNEEAARFSGIRTRRVKLRVYVIAGLTASIAGMVSLGRFGAISTNSASGYELTVVAAAVVGGASLSGGRGSAIGALLGALVLAIIEDGIVTMRWPSEYRLGIVGSAIIVAVGIDRLSETMRARRTLRATP